MRKFAVSITVLLIVLMIETYSQTYDEYTFEDYVREFSKNYSGD